MDLHNRRRCGHRCRAHSHGVIPRSSRQSRQKRYPLHSQKGGAGSPAEHDLKGVAGSNLAVESTEMAADLMKMANAKSLLVPILRDVWKRATENRHTKGREYRSIYWLFSQDGGRDVGKVTIE